MHQHWKQPNSIHWHHFSSTYHTKQLNSWLNSSASDKVNHSYLLACPEEKIEPFKDHLSTCKHLTSLRNKPQKTSLGKFHLAWIIFINTECMCTASYRVTVKCVSYCCLHGRRLFSSPVTYIHSYVHTYVP